MPTISPLTNEADNLDDILDEEEEVQVEKGEVCCTDHCSRNSRTVPI
jgi:hypothetical protein